MISVLHTGLFFVPMVLVASVANALVGNASGIYLTVNDYQRGYLTAESDCKSRGHKVQLHDVLNKPYIHVTHNGETRKYAKSEVYGFRTCEGRDYRFFSSRAYRILEARAAAIYSVQLPDREGDDLIIGGESVYEYFFSVGASGQVVPLTRENLKLAFPDNHRFHDAIDQMFRTDAELARYDDFHKMFKVNRLLIASASSGR